MLSLLFITNSPRSDQIGSHLQKNYKIRLDSVADFDQGLRDMFEKRPQVVCIQDHIGGVTGESVARHVQLLLGNGAPVFILLHDGSSKVRQVPGLFSYLLDLTLPFEQLCSNLEKSLKGILREQLEEARIPQQQPAEEGMLANIFTEQMEVQQESLNPEHPRQESRPDESADHWGSAAEVGAFFQEGAGGPPPEFNAARIDHEKSAEEAAIAIGHMAAPDAATATPPPSAPPRPAPAPHSFSAENPRQKKNSKKVVTADPVKHKPAPVAVVDEGGTGSDHLAFDEPGGEPVKLEQLLNSLEGSYRSRRRQHYLFLVLVVTLLLAALWHFWLKGRGENRPAVPVEKHQPQKQVQSAVSSSVSKQPEQPESPLFVKGAEQDKGYGDKNPGWSRYSSAGREYRLFHEGNRLKAVQIIARDGETITAAELHKRLEELSGSGEYRLSGSLKDGQLWREKCAADNAELLIYRLKKGGAIVAVVYVPTK